VAEITPASDLKTVILTVGNWERGDDGVGTRIAGLLKKRNRTRAIIFDAGVVPENYLGPVIDARPDRVLIVDACLFNGEPGEFRIFDRAEFGNLMVAGFSTHNPPLSLVADLIHAETGAEIYLLGIRPKTATGNQLSPAVQAALEEIVSFIESWVFSD
jgi:hydrogenase 3 maturation protease